jgi:hypothetical protein
VSHRRVGSGAAGDTAVGRHSSREAETVFAKSRGTRNEGWWRLRLVLAACTALGLLWGVSSAGAETVSQTFTYTGGE